MEMMTQLMAVVLKVYKTDSLPEVSIQPVYMITSVGAGFLSKLISNQSKVIKKLSKWKKEKIAGKKPL